MPSLSSGYSFEDFLRRLERSPVAYMSPLYHEHQQLFAQRPDMFTKAMLSVSWERGLALLKAAYTSQDIPLEVHRALLARMLLHNKQVRRSHAGRMVDWRAALYVHTEAVLAHGTRSPTHRITCSALRLLAPHRMWRQAIQLLQFAQVNGQLTKPMLLDGARACATPTSWQHALQMLSHLHQQEPALIASAIASLRPPGSSYAAAASDARYVLLRQQAQSSAVPGGPTRAQEHILRVLNDVVAAVPWSVAQHDALCHSYLTHLVASTTLSVEQKTRALSEAVRQLPWQATLALLDHYTEPALLSDTEWQALQSVKSTSAQEVTGSSSKRRKKKGSRKAKTGKGSSSGGSNKETTANSTQATQPSTGGDIVPPSSSSSSSSSHSLSYTDMLQDVSSATALDPLYRRMVWLQSSAGTVAAMMAVMVDKLPDVASATAFVRNCVAVLERHASERGQESHARGIAQQPVVLHALLRKCVAEKSAEAWRTAAAGLLEHGAAARQATPTDVLSALVLQLRAARQVALVVRLLQAHVVPSGSKLTAPALEAVLDCVLAHNRALHTLAPSPSSTGSSSSAGTAVARRCGDGGVVHWRAVLSYARDLQAPETDNRIATTGTGSSAGAVTRRPRVELKRRDAPLSPRMLLTLVKICIDGNSPQGALWALGYARKVDRTELPHAAAVRALLYCMLYDRPYEAEALVGQAEAKHGAAACKSLRQLLELMQATKTRQQGAGDDDEQHLVAISA